MLSLKLLFPWLISESKKISFGKLIRFPHYETIFKMVLILLGAMTTYLLIGGFYFRQYAKENGIKVIELEDFKLVPLTWFVIYMSKTLINQNLHNYFSVNLHQKYKDQDREMRIIKLLKWTYDGAYYFSASVIDTAWLGVISKRAMDAQHYWWAKLHRGCFWQVPNMAGGISYLISKSHQNDYLNIFYMIQLGSHSYSLMEWGLMGNIEKLKFWEYLLHHFLATSLIFFSSMYNCVIMIIHDISDIFLSWGRAFADLSGSRKQLVYAWYVAILASWIWTRICVFPTIIQTSFPFLLESDLDYLGQAKYSFMLNIGYMIVLMIVLQMMHVYWTVFMMKVGSDIFKSGRYKNVYDNKENKLDDDAKQKTKK